MILSIMGLFGVTLPVGDFRAEDRVKATLRLLQELTNRNGQAANWLYIAPELPPSPHLSTLLVMPETSESGRAYVMTPDGRKATPELIRERWDSRGAPFGKVNDRGYFIFSARAAKVVELADLHWNGTRSQLASSGFNKPAKQRVVAETNGSSILGATKSSLKIQSLGSRRAQSVEILRQLALQS
ncbi:hypothetical protein ISF_07834 [Cordyceps fumosorosea ARSEF 2679]|uniref:Uncharacterized protein n=1 Tax=Cordyceps fumosorosea (strain ARSEF 2679) TaxID=1081104 RepID=A0A167NMV1_CORFA|nr:hypothetical protein ISF_07834 [Cordyceps fumosorosea ARSEF 2679]OAA55729.1 hypothetical protein ISF_07834 [Cordyceps fumosorosea ARSEF 2679]